MNLKKMLLLLQSQEYQNTLLNCKVEATSFMEYIDILSGLKITKYKKPYLMKELERRCKKLGTLD